LVNVFEVIAFPIHTQEVAHILQHRGSRLGVGYDIHVALLLGDDAGFSLQALRWLSVHGCRGRSADDVMHVLGRESAHYRMTSLRS
jgi:hypothetical protein